MRGRSTLVEDLRRFGLELIETRLSWVFLAADQVWKVKKPVRARGLDHASAESRRDACRAELELNRRLAGDVYRDVVPVTQGESGRLRFGGEGEPVDWAVHMERLPDAERADLRLKRAQLELADVERLAARLAAFHGSAREDAATAEFGTVERLDSLVRETFRRAQRAGGRYLSRSESREIRRWQLGFLERHAHLFEERRRAGRVREGHGDLRLEHVFFGSEVLVIDCMEFDDRLRCADVCADVALLATDLAWHGRVDLAERFAAVYSREANDYDLYPLMDFFQSFRASVRAETAASVAGDPDIDVATRERAGREARRYALLALSAARRGLVPPAVVAVGGLIASGKSTLADRISAEMSAAVVVADRTREFLLQPDDPESDDPDWVRAFGPELPEAVYEEVLERAAAVLASGRPVVLDGCFRSRRMRGAARALAARHRAPFTFLECRVEPQVAAERLRRRAKESGASASGWLELYERLRAEWEPADEIPEDERLVLDTSRPPERNLARVRERLPVWPRGLTQ